MSNIIQLKHGISVPTTSNLEPYELGYCDGDGNLYLNINGAIEKLFGSLKEDISDATSNYFDELVVFDGDIIFSDKAKIYGNIIFAGKNQICGDLYFNNNLTLKRGAMIISPITDGTSLPLIYRYSRIDGEDTIRIGANYQEEGSEKQSGIYMHVGYKEKDTPYNAYIQRIKINEETQEREGANYLIFDQLSIGSGFTLNNGAQILAYLTDTKGTTKNHITERLIQRNNNNNIWIGGSTSSDAALIGSVYLAVGTEQNVYVYRRDVNKHCKIFDDSQTIPIANGGTGKTTTLAARNAIVGGLPELTTNASDTSLLVFSYTDPSDSNGGLFTREVSTLWAPLRNKIKAVSLYSGTLTKGNSTTFSKSYNFYTFYGKPGNGSAIVTLTTPYLNLTSAQFQIADDVKYFSFTVASQDTDNFKVTINNGTDDSSALTRIFGYVVT